MTLLHDDDRTDLEAGVRTMLRRLAAEVSARPPAWQDLVERHEAVVLPLDVAGSVTEARDRRPRRERRPRMSLAAAAVLVLAAAGALVVDRTGSRPTERPAAQTISAISPGDPSFDAGTAAAVWASGQGDPVAATLAYLAAMGVPAGAAAPPAVVLRGAAGRTAVVDWSFPAAAGGSRGTVYLRSSAAAGAPPTWTVVGSAASDVALGNVRYDGSRLSFTVTGTSGEAEQVAVGAWIDGRPVSLGGDPVAQAGPGNVALGELVDLGSDAHDTLHLAAEADDIVTLRVVRMVEGKVRSLTQMAVALPGADPAVAAAGTPSVEAGGHATGRADAGAERRSGSARAGGTASGSSGVDLAPGGTVPTLPGPPSLPTVPTIPGLPAPTLPAAPPTTVLGSATDHLP